MKQTHRKEKVTVACWSSVTGLLPLSKEILVYRRRIEGRIGHETNNSSTLTSKSANEQNWSCVSSPKSNSLQG